MRPRSKSQSLLIVLGAFILAGLFLAFGIITWTDHRETEREAKADLAEVARLVEEHASVMLRANTVLLNRVADHLDGRPFALIKESESDRQALRDMLADMPEGDTLWIFDQRGDLVTTTQGATARLNVADRDYFRALKETGKKIYMSPLLWGRSYGGYFMGTARRITDAAGNFGGVILASVDAGYFTDFYREVDPTGNAVFTILKLDGNLVMRWPLPQPPTERVDLTGGPILSRYLPRASNGSFLANSYIDGIERLMSYRKIANSELVVLVGSTTQAVFAGWRDRTTRNAAYGLGAAVVVVLLAGAAYASMGGEAAALREETAKAALLARAVSDNEVLFQELHHRIKNNLQIISSFLTMQRLRIRDPSAMSLLQESIDRIHSMGLVHQTLYLQREAAAVDIAVYLRSLAAYLAQSHYADQRDIDIEVEGDGVRLELDLAVPVALAVNEAVTNSLKHAFPNHGGRIVVGVGTNQDGTAVTVTDDGVGFPTGGAPSGGIGVHLLRALAVQIGGTVTFDAGPRRQGARVTLRFPGTEALPARAAATI